MTCVDAVHKESLMAQSLVSISSHLWSLLNINTVFLFLSECTLYVCHFLDLCLNNAICVRDSPFYTVQSCFVPFTELTRLNMDALLQNVPWKITGWSMEKYWLMFSQWLSWNSCSPQDLSKQWQTEEIHILWQEQCSRTESLSDYLEASWFFS